MGEMDREALRLEFAMLSSKNGELTVTAEGKEDEGQHKK
jgi:hypothetical protein